MLGSVLPNKCHARDRIDAGSRAARLLSRGTAASLVLGLGLAASATAYGAPQPAAASVYTMGPGRLVAIAAIALGVLGAVNGGRAVARSASGMARRRATMALVLGPIGFII